MKSKSLHNQAEERLITIYRCTRDVIKAEALAREQKLFCRVIPVPRSISPLCGMALELHVQDYPAFKLRLEDAGLAVESVEKKSASL